MAFFPVYLTLLLEDYLLRSYAIRQRPPRLLVSVEGGGTKQATRVCQRGADVDMSLYALSAKQN